MAQVVMVIDGHTDHAQALEKHIMFSIGLKTIHAYSNKEALLKLSSSRHCQPDIIIYYMENTQNASEMIRAMRQLRNDVQIIVFSRYETVNAVAEIIKCGANDFLVMPFHPVQLTTAVRNALIRHNLQMEIRHAWMGQRIALEDMEQRSKAMQATIFMAKSLADMQAPVVLEGTSGTGRELFARAIHGSSVHGNALFRTMNAALYAPEDVEGQLFGSNGQPGLVQQIQIGTLFIRNVECLSEKTRDKIIAHARNRKSSQEHSSQSGFTGRWMFAMNTLPRYAASKDMQVFFSQLGGVSLHIPCLQDVREDIPSLARLFCRRYAAMEGKPVIGLSAEAEALLMEMPWPGNIEQLAQAVFKAVMCCEGDVLEQKDFHYAQQGNGMISAAKPFMDGFMGNVDGASQDGVLSCTDGYGNVKRLQDVEQEIIRYALERYSGHMSEVAKQLGIGRSTLYRKLSFMESK